MSGTCAKSEHGRVCTREAGHEGRHNDGKIEWFADEQDHPLRGGHPLQPIALDEHGVARFKRNGIVRFLLDKGPFDLNKLCVMQFSDEDWEQFSQLIGYSVGGFSDLSYVSNAAAEEAQEIAERLIEAKKAEI